MTALQAIKIVGQTLLVFLLADLTFFLLWLVSGQVPPTEFYLGGITGNFLTLLL